MPPRTRANLHYGAPLKFPEIPYLAGGSPRTAGSGGGGGPGSEYMDGGGGGGGMGMSHEALTDSRYRFLTWIGVCVCVCAQKDVVFMRVRACVCMLGRMGRHEWQPCK